MLQTTIRLDLRSDFVLNDVTREFDSPFVVTHEEVHDDDTLTFVAEVPDRRDEIVARLEEYPEVVRTGSIGDSSIVVRKRSCGAIPVIRRHNGFLCGVDRAFGTERVFDVLTFNRRDIQRIVADLEELGTVSVEKLTQVEGRPADLSARQLEVVQTALEAGYFDWPREAEAADIAADLDITHPTFLEHLRKAEKKLLQHALSNRTVRTDGLVESDRLELDGELVQP